MKRRVTWILFIAVLLVGGFIAFYEDQVVKPEERRARAEKVMRLDASRVTSLHLVYGDQDIMLQRGERNWTMSAPVRTRASRGKIEHLLKELQNMRRAGRIPYREQKIKGLDLQEYGLEHPSAMITLEADGQVRTIMVGRVTPLGSQQFVKVDGRKAILIADKVVDDLLPSSYRELRDFNVFSIREFDIGKIEFQRDEGFLQLARTGQRTWMIQQPVLVRADRNMAGDLVKRISELKIEQYISEQQAEPAAYGLDEPESLTVYQDAGNVSEQLLIGDILEDQGSQFYARLEGYDAVFTVSTSLLGVVHTPVSRLRSRKVVPMDRGDVFGVEIRKGQELTQLALREDWQMTAPVEEPVDQATVQRLVDAWGIFRAEGFIEREVLTNAPDYRLLFRTAPDSSEAKGAAEVLLYADPDTDEWIGQLDGDTSMFEVPADLLKDVVTDPMHFRDRTVLDLQPVDVLSVNIQWDGDVLSAYRNEEGTFIGTEEGVETASRAARLVTVMCHPLKAHRFLSADAGQLAARRYGLDKPLGKIELGLTAQAGLKKTLVIGEPTEAGDYPAMVLGREIVFTLHEDTVHELIGLVEAVEQDGD